MKQRNIVLAIVLSIVTCGIYGIYWFIKLNDETNALANKSNATSGIMVFLFSLITCGIYFLYWVYKMGQVQDEALVAHGFAAKNLSIVYLILSLFGLGIVACALLQDGNNSMLPEA